MTRVGTQRHRKKKILITNVREEIMKKYKCLSV